MNSRLLRIVIGLGIAFLAMQNTAFACSCGSPFPPISRRFELPLVFIGKVIAIERPAVNSVTTISPIASPDGSTTVNVTIASSILATTTRISVDKQFRGAPATEIRVAGDGSSCDYSFVQGQSYLIYALSVDAPGINRCNDPIPLPAVEDLKYIEGTIAKQPQSILYGYAFRRITTADGKPALTIPTGNIDVLLEGAKGPIRKPATKTGEYGYEVVVPPGEYRVWLERDGKSISSPQTIELHNGEARLEALIFD